MQVDLWVKGGGEASAPSVHMKHKQAKMNVSEGLRRRGGAVLVEDFAKARTLA